MPGRVSEMDEVLVSIVVPVYNTQAYVGRCIESILAQTYSNWELILIDDGSTDLSAQICEAFAGRDTRITYYKQCNSGVSAARNVGISYSKGKYIYFMDSDDVAEPNLLETAVGCMIRENLDSIYFNLTIYGDDSGWNPDVKAGLFEMSDAEDQIAYSLREYLEFHSCYFTCNKIYRTDIIKGERIQFDKGVKIGEDIGFNLKYLFYVKKIRGISDKLYQYWKRDDSATSRDSAEVFWLRDFAMMLEGVWRQCRKAGIPQRYFDMIFIKTMDNQYSKRKKPKEFKKYMKCVENKRFYFLYTLRTVVQPWRIIKLYGLSTAKGKWKDHLYAFAYLILA